MRYVVYNEETGEIVRTYRKILAESGEVVLADEAEVVSDLPHGLTEDDVGVIPLKEFSFEPGKTYRVDLQTRQIVAEAKER